MLLLTHCLRCCHDFFPPPLSYHRLSLLSQTPLLTAHREAKLNQACEQFTLSADVIAATFGDDSAEYATGLCDLGECEAKAGQLPAAEAHLRQALAIRERVYSSCHTLTAQVYSSLALVLMDSGRLEESVSMQQLARNAFEFVSTFF